MEHIVQFAIGIDDETIQNRIESSRSRWQGREIALAEGQMGVRR